MDDVLASRLASHEFIKGFLKTVLALEAKKVLWHESEQANFPILAPEIMGVVLNSEEPLNNEQRATLVNHRNKFVVGLGDFLAAGSTLDEVYFAFLGMSLAVVGCPAGVNDVNMAVLNNVRQDFFKPLAAASTLESLARNNCLAIIGTCHRRFS
jgi:hypothetical protein